MLEIFQYDFMVRAFLVGIFTAITTAVLGNFVVASRQSVMSDMLAHTALVGVGIGIFFDISPTLMGFVATIISALILWGLSRSKKVAPEAISMLLLTGGLAMALLLTHWDKSSPVSLDTYLFGSILTITQVEMFWFIGLNIFLIGVLYIFWKTLLSLVFDPDFFQTQQNRIVFEIGLMLMVAIVVGIGLKVVGGLLIGALLVIPVLIAQLFTSSFVGNTRISILVNILAIILGLTGSFYMDVPASSAIVLTLVGGFILARIISPNESAG